MRFSPEIEHCSCHPILLVLGYTQARLMFSLDITLIFFTSKFLLWS
ncbi:hypothetical protein N44_00976 [Microcystis aeruginosa NIES-44]|uniref:Uncharacterized protein n=1 Tax=Microcystis aeruginosa NIES-44 TaxID=449439 RepID=A0A0A1VSQ0_MICAE|nr:hypothetical protein N44_00976 [Microcystis aeruginosa NIES-44]